MVMAYDENPRQLEGILLNIIQRVVPILHGAILVEMTTCIICILMELEYIQRKQMKEFSVVKCGQPQTSSDACM